MKELTPEQIKARLVEGIERRFLALTPIRAGGKNLPYKLHDGHWMRDLSTFKMYLLKPSDPKTIEAIFNLPEGKD